jgi:hypothetical protein
MILVRLPVEIAGFVLALAIYHGIELALKILDAACERRAS